MVYSGWEEILDESYRKLDPQYQAFLENNLAYFPSKEIYFNAFKTLPKTQVKYILFGQDPYPRKESAIGYAFIDAKADCIFSEKGLSKEVNRATSLRNFIKMALVARGDLKAEESSQEAISKIDKNNLISSMEQLRINFEKNGVLLLNTALIFTDKKSSSGHIKAWSPFMEHLLHSLERNAPKLILFGIHAKELKKRFSLQPFETIELEHPYNHSFISNPRALNLFGNMKLLEK